MFEPDKLTTADLVDAVMRRRSVRTYLREALPVEVTEYLEGICMEPGAGFRLQPLIDGHGRNFGTYGVIKNAPVYIPLIVSEEGDEALISGASRLENVVLRLTACGLGTCWLGATFHDTGIDLDEGERLEAVVAVGKPAGSKHFMERLTSALARSSTRRPFDDLFRISQNSPYRQALELVRLAPSSLNAQPWRATEDAGALHFYCKGDKRMNKIDMGIAFAHFELKAPAGHWTHAQGMPDHRGLTYVRSWLP